IDDASFYVLCRARSRGFAVERANLDGSTIDRTSIRVSAHLDGLANVVRQADVLYIWDARVNALSRIDLNTARVESTTATAVVPPAGPLDAMAALGRGLGRWIAPQVLAKAFLDPGIVVSPDGTRVYALGVDETGTDGEAGSRGVFVFDARTLESLGHWQPTADFVSLAISRDGRYLYAAGQPGRDAAGTEIATGASITVFDARDGVVRLVAGQLGDGFVTFPSGLVE
ncbi:MAG: hypothetical protein ACJ77U_04165, partial [Chloroflexota bacterium]